MKLTDYLLENKVKYIDKAGNITYSWVGGTVLDVASGLDFVGVLGSRGYASVVNYITGNYYMKYRERNFRRTNTTKEHSKLRRELVDLFSFNTFQTPIYMGAVTFGEIAQKGVEYVFSDGNFDIDLSKTVKGGIFLFSISPLISPTMNWWTDGFRKLFRVKPAVERAYEKQ